MRRLAAALALAAMAAGVARAGESEAIEAAAHARHHTVMPDMTAGPARSQARVVLPDVTLVREDGHRVRLREEAGDGRPVLLTFVFTTCSTICPTVSQALEGFQESLGARRGQVHMMSVSLDPEQDTPARLREYAARYSAGPQWQHYTGTVEASEAVQKAFGVYRTDKMNHSPVAFLRAGKDGPWIRIDGLFGPRDLLAAYDSLGIASR